jgi:hypothetical protein
MKKLRINHAARIAGFALVSLCVVLMVKGAVQAEEGPGEYRPSALMLVEGKARDRIVGNKESYRVTRETEVFDAQGKKLSLEALPVPCRAKVQYLPSRLGMMPEALRIVVTEVLQGATTKWKMPSPE